MERLPGFRDFYPAEFAERSHIFAAWRDVAQRFAFAEYDGPPLEPLDLYTKKSGEEIVGQLYNFEDKGGRQVALRPEMTPTVARMVAARANALLRSTPIRPARLQDCFGALMDYADAAAWGKTPITREAAARRATETPAAA